MGIVPLIHPDKYAVHTAFHLYIPMKTGTHQGPRRSHTGHLLPWARHFLAMQKPLWFLLSP